MPCSAVRDRVLVRLLVAVFVHRLRMDRGARRPARPDRALAGDAARRDLPGGRAEEPGGPSDQARIHPARLRALGALRRRALQPAGPVPDPDPERGAGLLVARRRAAGDGGALGAALPARLLHAQRQPRRPAGTEAAGQRVRHRRRRGRSGVELAARRRRGCARCATTRSRTASSARPSSSSTASGSGATTGGGRSSAGCRAARSRSRHTAISDASPRLPPHPGPCQPAGQPPAASRHAHPLARGVPGDADELLPEPRRRR